MHSTTIATFARMSPAPNIVTCARSAVSRIFAIDLNAMSVRIIATSAHRAPRMSMGV